VPAVVSGLQAQRALPGETNLNLAIGLPLRNREALTNLLRDVYDPASTNYHHYLTQEKFTSQFGPTEQDYQAVIAFVQAHGLTVTGTHPNRMLLNVSGKAGNVEKALNVTLNVYQRPSGTGDFFAPSTEPSIPSGLQIQDVSGLDSYRQPRSNYKTRQVLSSRAVTNAAVVAAGKKLNAGSGTGGTYMGDDFRNAYIPGTSLNGSGQTVALVQFDGYYASDIQEYESLAGRTNVPLQNVLLDGFSGAPTGNGGEVEVSLDIEMAISMAPALAKIIVYEGDPYNFYPNDVLNRIATDDAASQISCSWGWTGGPSATTDQIFQEMAIQGQSFFVASGDSDAYPAGTVDSSSGYGTPSDSAYVTSVGGTTLTMSGSGKKWSSETVWNWGITYGSADDGIGSSGGISSYYTIPTWQAGISMTACQGSTTYRNFPDVALTADNVLVVADGGYLYDEGGTSCASPLWAGFAALVNQQAVNNSHVAVGFINPAIYTIATASDYTNCFRDVTTDNNTWSGSPKLFYAVSGYDLCTGLGTPNGTNLINALLTTVSSTITHISPPPSPYGTTLAALNGGNPNGAWQLFVLDDAWKDVGVISNGWILTLTVASPVGFAADLALSMTASSTNVQLGSNWTCSLGVTNYGPSVSSNAVVVCNLPSTFTNAPVYPSQGSASRSGEVLTWTVGNLDTNAGALLTLTLHPTVTGNSFLNYAVASSDTSDPNTDNDSAYLYVSVVASQPPQFGSFISTNGTFQMTITSSSASTIVQASTNLVDWAPVYTNSASSFTFTDSAASSYPYRFYRAVSVQ